MKVPMAASLSYVVGEEIRLLNAIAAFDRVW
jgi:hypothetical protein